MSRLTYVVGDVHGRLDLLKKAMAAIDAHGAGHETRIVTLGDYVDRGPDSRGVVEYLIAAARRREMICLKGNHEAMMVDSIRSADRRSLGHWIQYGGEETMKSYGWSWRRTPDYSIIPEAHLAWMAGLPLMARDENRLYVHAGVDPERPLDEQDEAVCLWIRDRFLEHTLETVGLHVVHGHTPEWEEKPHPATPELLAHRTNLDTGAYYTGVLAVGVFDEDAAGGPLEVLTVTADRAGQEAVAPRWRQR